MIPQKLRAHLAKTYALPESQIRQLWLDIHAALTDSHTDFIRRRHSELRDQGYANADIIPLLVQETRAQLFRGPELSDRQVRRILHG